MRTQSQYSSLIPSAFQIIQFPTKCAYDYYLNNLNSIKQAPSTTLNDKLKLALIKFKLYLPGAFTYLLNVTLIPITIGADMVVGLGELSYRAYQGKSRDELIGVARCKWGASPMQQLYFMVPSILGPFIQLHFSWKHLLLGLGLVFKLNSLKKTFLIYTGLINLVDWVDHYGISQLYSAAVPLSLGKRTFDILIGGEDRDEEGDLFRSRGYLDKMWKKKIGPLPFSNQRVYGGLQLGSTDLKREGPYKEFYEKALKQVNPEELLSSANIPLSRQSTTKDVTKASRYWSLYIHPDKVPKHLRKEANALFQCLQEAIKVL